MNFRKKNVFRHAFGVKSPTAGKHRFGRCWHAISELGCTSQKKVPLRVWLKSTRPSYMRVWPNPIPPEAGHRKLDVRGFPPSAFAWKPGIRKSDGIWFTYPEMRRRREEDCRVRAMTACRTRRKVRCDKQQRSKRAPRQVKRELMGLVAGGWLAGVLAGSSNTTTGDGTRDK